jgi:hypothetical protein
VKWFNVPSGIRTRFIPPCMSAMPPGAGHGTWKSGSKLSATLNAP